MDDFATCIMCGRKYRACLSCKDKLKITPWKKYTDTVECWDVFNTLKGYHNYAISRAKAREQLAKIRYNKYDFCEGDQRTIDEILSEDNLAKNDTSSEGIVNDVIAIIDVAVVNDAIDETIKKDSFAGGSKDAHITEIKIEEPVNDVAKPTVETETESATEVETKDEPIKDEESVKDGESAKEDKPQKYEAKIESAKSDSGLKVSSARKSAAVKKASIKTNNNNKNKNKKSSKTSPKQNVDIKSEKE